MYAHIILEALDSTRHLRPESSIVIEEGDGTMNGTDWVKIRLELRFRETVSYQILMLTVSLGEATIFSSSEPHDVANKTETPYRTFNSFGAS